MAVTKLGHGAGNRAASSSATLGTSWTSFSIASSDANTVAIVLLNGSISTNAATTVAVTYGGVAMTALSLVNYGTTSTTRGFVGIYYLYNPGTGAKTVAITTSGATKTALAGIDVSFSGVDTTIGTAQTATTTTHSVTSVTNGYSLRVLSNGVTTGTLNQTSEYAAGTSVTGLGDFIAVQSAVGTGSNISFTASGVATTPNSIGVALSPYIPNPAFSTLTDDFNTGSTPNAAKWQTLYGTPTLTSGQLNGDDPSGSWTAVQTATLYDLTGDSFALQLMANTGTAVIQMSGTAGNTYKWTVAGTTATPTVTSTNGTSRTHTNGDMYRFRESGGTVYAEYSSDGTNWFTQHSAAIGAPVTGVRLQIIGQGPGSTTRWDNFNMPFVAPPSSGNSSLFFQMF